MSRRAILTTALVLMAALDVAATRLTPTEAEVQVSSETMSLTDSCELLERVCQELVNGTVTALQSNETDAFEYDRKMEAIRKGCDVKTEVLEKRCGPHGHPLPPPPSKACREIAESCKRMFEELVEALKEERIDINDFVEKIMKLHEGCANKFHEHKCLPPPWMPRPGPKPGKHGGHGSGDHPEHEHKHGQDDANVNHGETRHDDEKHIGEESSTDAGN